MGEPPFGNTVCRETAAIFHIRQRQMLCWYISWQCWLTPVKLVSASSSGTITYTYCILVHCICQQQKVTSARLCFAVTWGFYTYSYSNIEKLMGGGAFFQRTNLNSTCRIFRLLVPPAGLCPGDPGQMSRSLHVPRDYYLQSAPGIISGTRRFNFVGWKKIMEDCCPSIVTWGTNISLFISCKSIIT